MTDSYSNSFEKAIAFNNAGAQHIEREDYKSALKALTVAFYSFKKTYNQNQRCPPPTSGPSPSPSSPASSSPASSAPASSASLATPSSASASSQQENQQHNKTSNIDEFMKKLPYDTSDEEQDKNKVSIVYQHPIRLPETLESSMDSCGLASTAITFNLALANHLLGLETKNVDVLKTAARLYEYGISLERIRGRSLVSHFFLLSNLNNLGHVHRNVNDSDRSRKCFRQLLSTLLYLTQNRRVNPNDVQAFFGSTSLGSSTSHCAGAA